MTEEHPTLSDIKQMAKRLRAKLDGEGTPVTHSKSLELIAHQHGYRDWNALSAAVGKDEQRERSVGDRVRGRYFGQPFEAVIVSADNVGRGWTRLTLDLDEAIDVVTFDSFSNFRKRVRGVIGPLGLSREKTSDGQPHLQVET